ncbi:phage tail tape measure protein [Massilimicrobiota sp. An142]|uniref:phage tail tape measure protein n=1 Tax=Massilimicrobiota sp. An142 TaxID=1965564 RepID=UPI000B3AF3DC|nr:phage tail tape measure protein [Massilimicrobiota sp. An142]OUQ15043.1 phage tail tape measure protein [Massilimicrobiota sp. An142]
MNNVGSISVDFEINTQKALQSLQNVKKEMENIANDIKNMNNQSLGTTTAPVKAEVDNSSLDDAFNTISAYFGMNTINAIVNVAADAAKIDYDMLDAKILADMSDKEYDIYSKYIFKLSGDSGIDVSEIISASNDAFSNDVSSNEIETLMNLSSKLSIANNSSIESSTGVLTSIKNSIGLQVNELGQVADYITQANTDYGRVDIEALAQGLKRNASYLTSGKIKLSEYLAMGEVYTSQGIGMEESQTFISNYLAQVDSASDATKKWAKETLNLDFSMKNLNKLGVKGFTEEVMKKTGGNSDYISKLFGGIRGRNAFDALAGDIDKYGKALDNLKNSRGALDDIFDQKMETPFQKWTVAVNKFKNAMVGLGQKLSPILTGFASALNVITAIINAIPAPVVRLIAVLLTLISVMVILNGAASIVKIGLKSLVPMFNLLKSPVKNTIGFFKNFDMKLLATGGYILFVAYLIWFLYENFDVAGNAIGSVLMLLVGIVATAFYAILKIVDTVLIAMSNAIIGFVNGIGGIVNAVGDLIGMDGLGWKFDEVKRTFITGAADLVGEGARWSAKIGKEMGDLSEKNYNDHGLEFNPFNSVSNGMEDASNEIENMATGAYDDISKDFSGGDTIADGIDDIGDSAENAGDGVDSLTDSLNDNRKTWDDLKSSLEETADSFNDISAKFEQMTYKVINSADLLKTAQYNLAITNQWAKVRDNLLGNSNLSGYALNYIAGLDASNLGELKALSNLSNSDLSKWNSMMNNMNKVNTYQAGKTEIIENNFTINRVKNEKEIIDYISKVGKKQGWAK